MSLFEVDITDRFPIFSASLQAWGWDSVKALNHPPETPMRIVVGILTGPDNDLVCLKRCETKPECDLWLSPARETLGDAILAARSEYLKLKRIMPRSADEWERSKGLQIV